MKIDYDAYLDSRQNIHDNRDLNDLNQSVSDSSRAPAAVVEELPPHFHIHDDDD